MANQLILGRALDANGYIASGAKATIYADGTSTLITIYSDVDGTTPAANPIIADGDGFWPQRYVDQDAKAVVTDANDVALYTLDPAPTAQGTGAAAASISFSPTVDIPQTNVQAAIERAGQLATSGFAAFGLGTTGNATLLANLDATGTGAGVYRFDGTTTGTFPTGVAAGDTGMVELWRQTGATAMMELHHATSNRVFRRRLTASTWGAWREALNVNQATVEGDTIYRGPSDFVRLPKGTAGQLLRMNAAATAPTWGGIFTWLTPQTTSSGTEFDFTGIASWASEIIVAFSGVSLNGSDSVLIQLGDSGGFETTGYNGGQVLTEGSLISTGGAVSSGFVLPLANAANAANGFAKILRPFNSNEWISDVNMARGAQYMLSAQTKTLSDTLTQVRITRSGANTFDGGTVNVGYR